MPDPDKKPPESAPKAEGGETKTPAVAKADSLKPAEAAPAKLAVEVQRTPKELRLELERVRKEAQDASTAKTALEAKILEFEKKGKDTEALSARLDAREKEFERLQGELRALKRETTPEFKKQYDEPFNQAAEWAKEYVNRLTLENGQPANYDQHFVPLYRLAQDSTLGAARAKAREIFGEDEGEEVYSSIKDLVRLDKVRTAALQVVKTKWAEEARQEEGLRVQQREHWNTAVQKVREELPRTPENEGYRDPADDKELATLRQQGYQIFDAEPKTTQEAIWKKEHERQRVAAFGPNMLTIKRLNATIASLREEIASLKPKQPNPDNKRGSGAPPEQELSWEDQARKELRDVV
jgi:hypothetical protein